MTTPTVNVKNTISLHPNNIEAIAGLNVDTEHYVAGVKKALETAYNGNEAILKAKAALELDPSQTKEAKMLKLYEFAFKKQQAAAQQFDTNLAHLTSRIKELENTVNRPLLQQAGAGVINEEIRRHLKSLPDDKRNGFLIDAMAKGDDLTLTAILGAPAYLSGLTPEIHNHHREAYVSRKFPNETTELAISKKALALLEDRSGLLFSSTEKAMGFSHAVGITLKQKVEFAKAQITDALGG